MRSRIPGAAAVLLAGLAASAPLRAEDAAADAKKERDAAVQAALDEFRKAYKGGDEDRAGAIRALGGATKDRKVVDLLGKAALDPSPPVRAAAAEALAGYEKSREAGQALVRALAASKKQPEAQIACLDALGKVRDWNTAPAILDCFNDSDSRVGAAAMRAAGAIKSPAFVKDLIKFLDDVAGGNAARSASMEEWRLRRQEARAAAHQALCDITGENKAAPADPGLSLLGGRTAGKEWEEWWKVYGARTTAKLQKEEKDELDRIAKEKRPY
jgi:HEAT repeat protein